MRGLEEALVELCRGKGPSMALDWEGVYRKAVEEGLGGVVYLLSKEMIPGEYLSRFRRLYHTNLARNLSILKPIGEVLSILEDEGISAVVLRGPSLFGDVYPSLGMRTFGDVDLLVRKRDFPRAVRTLEERGFMPWYPYICTLERDGLVVDLHTSIMTHSREEQVGLSVRVDVESLFERALRREIGGVEIPGLHPADGLLAMALHLQMHSFNRLIAFLDISRTIEVYREDIDWDEVVSRAEGMGLDRPLFYTLYLMPRGWRTFDPSLMERLASTTHLERLILDRLREREVPYAGEALFLLNIRGFYNKLAFIKGVLLPEEERDRLPDLLLDRLGKVRAMISALGGRE